MNKMFAPLTADEKATANEAPKPAGKTPIVPVPADAAPFAFKHPKHGEPSRCWPYHAADGQLVGYVCRWVFTDADGKPDKEILPVTYCDLGNGKRGWRSKGIPAPRPLFGLPDIATRSDAVVIICEGEKARDAASVLFPDMVATTPAHGAKSPHLTDFGPCTGRTVVIATDFDEPGRTNDKGKPLHPGQDFGDKVCELVRDAGANRVLHLHPDRLGAWRWINGEKVLRGEAMPDGWDLADAIEEGWTADEVAKLHDDPAFLPHYMDEDARKAARSFVDGEDGDGDEDLSGPPFRVVWNGVEKRIERTDKETGRVTHEWKWFCSHLEIGAHTRSQDNEDWGRLLHITDEDDREKYWAMPMAMLAGDGTTYRERLLSLGLIMAPGKFAREALHEYISTARPAFKARCVNRVGWHSGAFTFPSQTAERQNG